MYRFNLFSFVVLLGAASGTWAMEPAQDEQFDQQLIAAAEIGNVTDVNRLLALRPDLNFLNTTLQRALQISVANQHIQIQKILGKHYAQSKVLGGTALMRVIGDLMESTIEQSVIESEIKMLIEYGCDINGVLQEYGSLEGCTALHLAVAVGNEGICKILLDAGARIDMQDAFRSTPLIEAAKGRGIESSSLLAPRLIRYLQQRNANIMTVILCFNRLRYEGNSCAQLLYKQFMPLIGRYLPLYVSLEKLLRVKDEDGRRAFDYIPSSCLKPLEYDSLMARPVISIGGSHDELNQKLMLAARDGKFEKVRRLLAGGAKANHVSHSVTALKCAARHGHEEVCKLLLANGANVNVPLEQEYSLDLPANEINYGELPLMIAVENNDVALCKLFLAAGAQVNSCSRRTGEAALHVAAKRVRGMDDIALSLSLLDAGARLDIQNQKGETPVICAAKRCCDLLASDCFLGELMINHPSIDSYSSRQEILQIKDNERHIAHDYFNATCLKPDLEQDAGRLANCSLQ
jgi:ankyrin repeat protein